MIRIGIDGTQHCPVDTTSRGAAVEECRRSRVDSQVPSGELFTLSLIHTHTHECGSLTLSSLTSCASGDLTPL